jgi:FtsZ-binding cell division protein ZapB
MAMQLPGLDELEALITRAVDEIGRLKGENAELDARLRGLGKEIDDLAAQIQGVVSGQKTDSRKRKRIEKRLESIVEKLG